VRRLVFRSLRDEAFLYLSALALLTSSPFFVWSVIVTCTRWSPLIAVFLLLAMCNGNDFVTETNAFVSTNSLYIAAIGIACLYPTAILASLLITSLLAFTRGNRYAFGWIGFLGAALLDIQPMPVPKAANCVPVSLVKRPGSRLTSLTHSSYYSDPSVLREIVSFLRGSNVGRIISPEAKSPRRWEPLLRWIVVGVALVVSAAAMLRYDFIEQQKVVWEEGAQFVPQAGWREIFNSERTALHLGPQKAYTIKLDFGTMAPGETCRLVGSYRSDGSKIDVVVQIVRLSDHSDHGEFENMLSRWTTLGGARLVPLHEPPPAGAETDMEMVLRAEMNKWYEAGFRRVEIDISDEHRERKEVHFNRVLSGAEPEGAGGMLLRNDGNVSAITVDVALKIICQHQP
jgi:hypothetical protein